MGLRKRVWISDRCQKLLLGRSLNNPGRRVGLKVLFLGLFIVYGVALPLASSTDAVSMSCVQV